MDTRRQVDPAWEHLSHDGQLWWFAVHPSGRRLGGQVRSAAALARLRQNLEDWNVYAHANVPRGHFHYKAATRHIRLWRYVVVDLDPITHEAHPIRAVRLLADQLGGVAVHTGRGSQLWVTLKPPLELTSYDDRLRAEYGMGRWLRELPPVDGFGVTVDTSCSDLARVVRLPGSINQKTRQAAQVLQVLEPQTDGREVMRVLPRSSDWTAPAPQDSRNLAALIPHLNETAVRFLTQGWFAPGRHSAAYAAAVNLFEAAVPAGRVARWVSRGAALCAPPLPPPDARRAVACAFSRAQRPAV